MKKKISLLLCILIMTLSFAGCSDKSVEESYDREMLESSAEFIISNFSQMQEADLEQFKSISGFQLDYTMMQTGLKVSGESFVGMINSWQAAEEECGAYISHGDYQIEVKNDGITVSTLAQYEKREADILFTFDMDGNMESMDVSAKFSIGEILTKAGLNTLLGMGTVFAVLIFLAFIISLFKYIPDIMNKLSGVKTVVPVEKETITETIAEDEVSDDLELVAVITAAIAAQEGTSTDGFVVRSIRRRPSNNWN
ncbi:MAG: OadG family protein [Tyzzerella sp.]|nr:OadG family protein [Tyzzerella sp.]